MITREEDGAEHVIEKPTGEGVSGALVMGPQGGIFRMLSKQDQSDGEIVIRANWRTKKDIKTGMFVPRDTSLYHCVLLG